MSTPHFRRAVARLAVAGCLGVPLGVVATPAAAHHVQSVVVSQVAADELAVTLQVDVTFSGSPGSGVFEWTTGDGGNAAVPDGTRSDGSYLGDGAGGGTFAGSRPAGVTDTTTFDWTRTRPAANVARTMLRYRYATGGTYSVRWTACCAERSGTLPVAVRAAPGSAPNVPSGVIEISGVSAAGATWRLAGAVPPAAQWTCASAPMSSGRVQVSCTPPPATGATTVCAGVAVVADSGTAGYVDGTSACDSGPPARAYAGPWVSPVADAQQPRTGFPWTCTASVELFADAAWLVRCAVGP